MIRSIVAAGAVALVAASVSGATEQPPPPIETAIPAPHFGAARSGPFSPAAVRRGTQPLGPGAPRWARRLYRTSVRVLVALTDPRTGAMIAGERDGWDYVWPRDAAAGAIALQAAGLRREAGRVAGFLDGLDLDAARFYPDGDRVPGRTAAGDEEGWVEAADRAGHAGVVGTVLLDGRRTTQEQDGPLDWRDRQDYGENVTGDLLGNAVASGAPAAEIRLALRDPARAWCESRALMSSTPPPHGRPPSSPGRGLRGMVRRTLLQLTRESTTYGIPPMEGWTPGQVWTAPTAWSAWALARLGDTRAADRLLRELRRAATPHGTLPERVDASTGEPTSTTPLAWSHAFAILALRARYPG